jgi:hypothetical protein
MGTIRTKPESIHVDNGPECTSTEDGYAPGAGDQGCAAHTLDYNPQDWRISMSELLRAIQFYNTPGGYAPCDTGEDGFCPATAG